MLEARFPKDRSVQVVEVLPDVLEVGLNPLCKLRYSVVVVCLRRKDVSSGACRAGDDPEAASEQGASSTSAGQDAQARGDDNSHVKLGLVVLLEVALDPEDVERLSNCIVLQAFVEAPDP